MTFKIYTLEDTYLGVVKTSEDLLHLLKDCEQTPDDIWIDSSEEFEAFKIFQGLTTLWEKQNGTI